MLEVKLENSNSFIKVSYKKSILVATTVNHINKIRAWLSISYENKLLKATASGEKLFTLKHDSVIASGL